MPVREVRIGSKSVCLLVRLLMISCLRRERGACKKVLCACGDWPVAENSGHPGTSHAVRGFG